MIEKITTSITIDSKKHAEFKSICALKNLNMSIQLEAMILKFIEDYNKKKAGNQK